MPTGRERTWTADMARDLEAWHGLNPREEIRTICGAEPVLQEARESRPRHEIIDEEL